jgi:hypothetical protein
MSYPRFHGMSGEAAPSLIWTGAPGRTYDVLVVTNLYSQSWIMYATGIPGTGAMIIRTDTNAIQREKFYQLKVKYPQ